MTTPTTVNVRLQLRADTAANWTAANPTLLANEVGLETDTKKLKVGNGSSAWNSLAYFPSIVSGGTVLGNLEIGTTGTLTFEGSTADGFETTLAVTNPTADRTITLPNQSGTVVVSGNASIVDADIAANAEIAVSKLANGTANQVIVTDGTNVSWSDNLTLAGDLTVNGTTTTINTQDLLVEDKNIIIGNVATPTDVTADGGGITLKGATDKTINWVDATDAWTSSERFSVPLGSASLPSLTFTGDENTGIYSPGADQVAISTNGTGRLFVDSSGLVDVVTSANTGSIRLANTTTNATAKLGRIVGRSYTNSDGDFLAFDIRGASATENGINYGGGSGLLKAANVHVFYTASDTTTASGTEKLRITSDGKLGVGTSSPGSYQLYVNTTGAYSAVFQTSTDQSSNSAARRISLTAQNYRPTIQGELLASGWSATDLLLNPSGGNVGIGRTDPQATLDVQGAVSVRDGSSYQWRSASGGTDQKIWDTYADNTSGNTLAFRALNDAYSAGYAWLAVTRSGNQPQNIIFYTGAGSERARIDSSGRLLVGTSSQLTSAGSLKQEIANGNLHISSFAANAFANSYGFTKSRSASSIGTIVQSGDELGNIDWLGDDGTSTAKQAARIQAFVDGTPGTDDMPGRLVFSTTADGASSPTEQLRITSDGVQVYNQPSPPTNKTGSSTLTVDDLKTGIMTHSGGSGTLTLPTGTLTEGGFSNVYTNMAFEWSLIHTGAGTATVAAGTGHTLVGSGAVSTDSSGRFLTRRTGANTFVSYRLS